MGIGGKVVIPFQGTKENVTLDEVDVIVEKLLGRYLPCWSREVDVTENPARRLPTSLPNHIDHPSLRDLFLWALLTEHWKLAEVLWYICDEPLASAAAAAKILWSMASHLEGHTLRVEQWKELKEQQR